MDFVIFSRGGHQHKSYLLVMFGNFVTSDFFKKIILIYLTSRMPKLVVGP